MRDYSFGNFISTLRERKGLSQYQLGVLVDVSDKAVSKWENGESEPSIDKLIKLSKYLELVLMNQCHLDKVFYDENSISYAFMH